MWTKELPTDPHYYYLKTPNLEVIGKLNAYGIWTIDGHIIGDGNDLLELGILIGRKVPTPNDFEILLGLCPINYLDSEY